jgi:hypothetical protein
MVTDDPAQHSTLQPMRVELQNGMHHEQSISTLSIQLAYHFIQINEKKITNQDPTPQWITTSLFTSQLLGFAFDLSFYFRGLSLGFSFGFLALGANGFLSLFRYLFYGRERTKLAIGKCWELFLYYYYHYYGGRETLTSSLDAFDSSIGHGSVGLFQSILGGFNGASLGRQGGRK